MIKDIIGFQEIVNMIDMRKNNAYKKVNEELILLYWEIGKYVSEKISCFIASRFEVPSIGQTFDITDK